MSPTARETMAAKAARLRAMQTPPSKVDVGTDALSNVDEEVSITVPGRAPAVRTRPVRVTLDLSPADHASLARLCVELAGETGRTRVTTQDVLRILVRQAFVEGDVRALLADRLSEPR